MKAPPEAAEGEGCLYPDLCPAPSRPSLPLPSPRSHSSVPPPIAAGVNFWFPAPRAQSICVSGYVCVQGQDQAVTKQPLHSQLLPPPPEAFFFFQENHLDSVWTWPQCSPQTWPLASTLWGHRIQNLFQENRTENSSTPAAHRRRIWQLPHPAPSLLHPVLADPASEQVETQQEGKEVAALWYQPES